LRVGAQIFLGLPFAEVAGTIEEIRTDFSPTEGRMLVRDKSSVEIVRIYKFPKDLDLEVNPATGSRYAVGDSVEQFAPLIEGVAVIDYIKDPSWFKGLINQHVFDEVQKCHTFTIRIASEIFSIPTLLLVQNFVLKAKPCHTYPVFVITFAADDAEVDVTDTVTYDGTLSLYENINGRYGSTMFDDPRAGGGGYWNQFDSNDDVLDAAPMYPTPDTVEWGFDKGYLCPTDSIALDTTDEYDTEVIRFDSVFAFDTPVKQLCEGVDSGPFPPSPIPAVPGAYLLAATTDVALDSEVVEVRILVLGGPGDYATDYEVVITADGAELLSVPVTLDKDATEVRTVVSGSTVTAGQTIGYKIRIPADSEEPTARNPDWTYICIRAVLSNGNWAFDDPPENTDSVHTLPAGIYTSSSEAV
jgi:hypothetical protein